MSEQAADRQADEPSPRQNGDQGPTSQADDATKADAGLPGGDTPPPPDDAAEQPTAPGRKENS